MRSAARRAGGGPTPSRQQDPPVHIWRTQSVQNFQSGGQGAESKDVEMGKLWLVRVRDRRRGRVKC